MNFCIDNYYHLVILTFIDLMNFYRIHDCHWYPLVFEDGRDLKFKATRGLERTLPHIVSSLL